MHYTLRIRVMLRLRPLGAGVLGVAWEGVTLSAVTIRVWDRENYVARGTQMSQLVSPSLGSHVTKLCVRPPPERVGKGSVENEA